MTKVNLEVRLDSFVTESNSLENKFFYKFNVFLIEKDEKILLNNLYIVRESNNNFLIKDHPKNNNWGLPLMKGEKEALANWNLGNHKSDFHINVLRSAAARAAKTFLTNYN